MGNALAVRRTARRHYGQRPSRFGARGASLGLTRTRTYELIGQIERGLPYRAIESLSAASGLTVHEIAAVAAIAERTLARRRTAGRLRPDESERLLRLATIVEKAVELFEGDVGAAMSWLKSPRRVLGDQTPLAASRTEVGAREVENLIGRLEHGVFS
jgi:putative toxin-antitoxin system antitoxin component (TIGR02293 family)